MYTKQHVMVHNVLIVSGIDTSHYHQDLSQFAAYRD